VSIRLQLLIVALTTLVLPWAGCQYARELETALRDSQEGSLLASAGTIANALSAQPQRVFRDPDDSAAFAPSQGDLYVYPLRGQPALDGYRDDWGISTDPTPLPTRNGYVTRVQAGSTERYLYLFIEVDDAHFDAEPGNAGLVDVAIGRRLLSDVITLDRDTNINLVAFVAPESRRDRRIYDGDIRKAFAQLPPKYRLVATLALIEDEPYEKIAAAAGISASLVKIQVFRAVRMLRKQLASLGIKDAKS